MDIHKPESLSVVSLRAEDIPTTAHWYRDVIGLQLMPHHGPWPAFALGNGVHLVIVQGATSEIQSPRFPIIAFTVPDLDAAVDNLHAHGVETPWGIEANPSARWVMCYDPAGNLIELVEFH